MGAPAPVDVVREFLASFVRDSSFLERYPYYASILGRVQPVLDPSVDSMAVSAHERGFYLHVNVDWFTGGDPPGSRVRWLRGILLHEVHHLVLGHLTHPKFFGLPHPELLEIAEEISANEWIDELLPDPITWESLANIGMRKGQSTLERYELLVAAARNGSKGLPPLQEMRTKIVDRHGWNSLDRPPPGGLERTRVLLTEGLKEGEALIQEDPRLPGGTLDEVARHPPARGRQGQPLPPTPLPSQRALIAGRTPARLVEELFGSGDVPSCFVDWRQALRTFVAWTRSPVHTYARPNRRFPHRAYEVAGRTWSRHRVERPRLLVAIDTSMSMSASELIEVARQLRLVADHAEIVVAECDVVIQDVYGFTGSLTSVCGRGGTDLRPPFEPAFLSAQRVDGVVYFTDGLGPYPERAPVVPTLWVLTKNERFDCPWGQRAELRPSRKSMRAAPTIAAR